VETDCLVGKEESVETDSLVDKEELVKTDSLVGKEESASLPKKPRRKDRLFLPLNYGYHR